MINDSRNQLGHPSRPTGGIGSLISPSDTRPNIIFPSLSNPLASERERLTYPATAIVYESNGAHEACCSATAERE